MQVEYALEEKLDANAIKKMCTFFQKVLYKSALASVVASSMELPKLGVPEEVQSIAYLDGNTIASERTAREIAV